jgi:hypothetical protein
MDDGMVAIFCPPGPGDGHVKLLVNTAPYGVAGLTWCDWDHTAQGTAATYPYKVRVPGRGVGQYRASEVHGLDPGISGRSLESMMLADETLFGTSFLLNGTERINPTTVTVEDGSVPIAHVADRGHFRLVAAKRQPHSPAAKTWDLEEA